MQSTCVSIIMPAYNAHKTIARSVASVLDQTHIHFELIVVSDDGADYAGILSDIGIIDDRIHHCTTGQVGGGSSRARNLGLDAAKYRFCAILDADDRFAPDKLAMMVPKAAQYGLASCALNVTDSQGKHLRHVAKGQDRLLTPADYKFTNFSMDSMLVYDRERADPRYDPALPCMTDLDFLLKIFATIPQCYHLGAPLHDYVKMPVSVSNGPGVTEKMIRTKILLRERLAAGHYGLDPDACAGLDRFLALSLATERAYDPQPGSIGLFEDHIEPRLSSR